MLGPVSHVEAGTTVPRVEAGTTVPRVGAGTAVPHVGAGTAVPRAHLALLDGNNIRETAQHPGPICKHRNFWLITAIKRANDHVLKTTSGHKSCLVFPDPMVISILFSTCELRK